MKKYISVLLLLIYAWVSYGKEQSPFFFSHLGVEDGLSQVTVLTIFQDSDGYLWFGTRNGANRYDGYAFKIYQPEVNNQASISDSYITKINEDKDKNIWIATSNGVNCIDYKTQQITRLYPKTVDSLASNTIQTFLRHADGELYLFTTYHVFRCNPDKTIEKIPGLSEIGSPIHAVVQDADGDIFMGTERNGLYVYAADWTFKQHFPADTSLNMYSLPSSTITSLFSDVDNTLFIGTLNNGLCVYDKKTQRFTRLNTHNTELNNNSIRNIIQLNKDSLLIGTFRGLNILNTRTMRMASLQTDIKTKGGLSHYSVHGMLIDKDGTLWIGTYSAGINYHSPFYKRTSFITPNAYAGIVGQGAEDKNGTMWFATEGAGLLAYNPTNGTQQLYPIKPLQQGNYETNIIKSILLKDDVIYCATHFGSVYLFSIETKTYRKIYDYKFNDINCLYIDSKQRLWIPTNTAHHLVMIDGEKEVNRFRVDGKDRLFRGVSLIQELKSDVFLFGTMEDGVFIYNKTEEQVTDLTGILLGDERNKQLGNISAAVKDRDGELWIATTKGGLFRLNSDFTSAQNYQKENGLTESYIKSLTVDKNGQVWVVTGKDIYQSDSLKNRLEHVKLTGLPMQEYTLFANNCVSTDGTLYFPGNQGILAINPKQITTNPNIPPVHITALLVNGAQAPTGESQPIEILPQQHDHHITLKANQKNITIRYSALNFIYPQNNTYAYKMNGVDNHWNQVGNRREAYYSNLAPGTYTFRVRASNNDGVWNPDEAILRITITPPFYQSWWAYLIYIILISMLVLTALRHQQRKQERKREEKYKELEQKKTNELHEERMRMFANFSHELRTPLTLIINQLKDILQRASFSPEVKKALTSAKKNTDRMLLLVNNLMDIQRYEAGKTVLQHARFDFTAFIREVYHSFESLAANREINFTLDCQLPDPFYTSYDKMEIEKVFFNLLSNAFKFTPPGGTISLRITRVDKSDCIRSASFPEADRFAFVDEHYVFIEIVDTGKGFDQQEADKIFEPFYRGEKDIHRQASGTGIGLSLSRSIVLQHQGYIWAESEPEKGTTFRLLLPDTEKQILEQEEANATPLLAINKKVALLVDETSTRNKSIVLLVDDNRDVLNYLEQQLEADYVVLKAENGKEALERITQKMPNIVICDVVMPKMNGLELCKQIKENPQLNHIPVILLTARSMISQIEEGLECGADDYIAKPFYISLLKARIKNILTLRENIKQTHDESLSLRQLGLEEPEDETAFLNQYIEIVKANISNPELDVSVIYQELGMSRANFYRKVKSVTGLSPIELIKNIRLQAGCKLLVESNLNISEIAQQVGFGSRSYFARSFKAVYGMSPTEYQERNKEQ